MSAPNKWEIVSTPPPRHDCELPPAENFQVGTVIKCTVCNKKHVCREWREGREDGVHWLRVSE
ncbi:hypothetical protein GCM10009861_02020 [Neomicrococcus aestuarii]